MLTPDLLNGLFEFGGAFAIWLSVRRLHRDKQVRGVSWPHTAFFASWGFWNIYYYAAIDQWFSWAGGICLVTLNTIWLAQMAFYILKEKTRELA